MFPLRDIMGGLTVSFSCLQQEIEELLQRVIRAIGTRQGIPHEQLGLHKRLGGLLALTEHLVVTVCGFRQKSLCI